MWCTHERTTADPLMPCFLSRVHPGVHAAYPNVFPHGAL